MIDLQDCKQCFERTLTFSKQHYSNATEMRNKMTSEVAKYFGKPKLQKQSKAAIV